jgi:hypothetical protein
MDGHIDFPLTLNMLPYTVKKDKERVDTSKYLYDLSTVVVHQGSMDSGHYYSYTRLGGDKVCDPPSILTGRYTCYGILMVDDIVGADGRQQSYCRQHPGCS